MLRRRSIALVVLLAIPAHAAITYRYSIDRDGRYAKHTTATVLMDGDRWRIDLDHDSGDAVVATSRIKTAKGEVIALNAENQTWYRVKESSGSGSMLFAYGMNAKLSKVKIEVPAPGRITFSYRFTADLGTTIHGDVHGEIRVSDDAVPADLPWTPSDISSGLDQLDAALRPELAKLAGRGRTVELELSRRIEDGVVLKETTRRTIGEITITRADPKAFEIPAGYRYQEPVLGVPAGGPGK